MEEKRCSALRVDSHLFLVNAGRLENGVDLPRLLHHVGMQSQGPGFYPAGSFQMPFISVTPFELKDSKLLMYTFTLAVSLVIKK